MKMAKPSQADLDAAGDLLAILNQVDRGHRPGKSGDLDAREDFDPDRFEHLREFYDAIVATLDRAPNYPGRVIGGMCYVIMYDKNEIVDPSSATIALHPRLVRALEAEQAVTSAVPAACGVSDADVVACGPCESIGVHAGPEAGIAPSTCAPIPTTPAPHRPG